MFRKLSLALAVSAALSSTGAFALGLGDITIRSALNENFNADIPLVSVDQDEIVGVNAQLASPADFANRGLERPFLLSKLRFEPMAVGDGGTVIRVTTKDAVREPFLNFLVEVNWPKGRLIREFTVLLDPPVTVDRRPPPTLPAITAPVEVAMTPEPVVQRQAREESYVPVAAVAQPLATTAGDYGRVPRGATAWSIAEDMGIAGATTEQVVMALLRSNPHAFAGNNVNNLMAGANLRIPDREAIFSQSPRQARAEFRAQAKNWSGPQAMPADRLQIAAAPAEEPPATDIEQVKTDLMMVRETGESTRQETEELRSRIRELEAQLADIRQLLKLKSDQLAALQAAQMAPSAPAEEEAAMAPEAEAEVPPAAVEEPESVPSEETVAAEVTEPEEPAPVVEEAAAPVEAAEPAEQVVAEPAPVAVVEREAAVEAEPPRVQPPEQVAPPPPRTVAVPPEPGLIERLFSNSMLLGIAAAVAVVLLALGWVLIRRRREAEEQYDDSILLAPNESTTVELEKEADMTGSVDHVEETSFISDFSPSDIDALQDETGEVDPAAEADVYIAYGRYQQAEILINQAIEKAPDRLDLKLKLAEIYFTTRNVDAFNDLAEQLDSAGAPDKDPQLWARIQSMGRELVPGHGLFGAAEPDDEGLVPGIASRGDEGSLVADSEALATDSEVLASLDLDLDTELSELQEQQPFAAGWGRKEEVVLEPPMIAESKEPMVAVGDDEEDSEFAIDLSDLDALEDIDLGDLGMDTEEAGAGQPVAPVTAEATTAAEPEGAVWEEPVLEESGFELSQFDLEEPATSELEAGEPLSEMLEEAREQEEDSDTKLDLARAYLEMGDTVGASEFLEEVLEEGNDEQKSAAKELLDKIRR